MKIGLMLLTILLTNCTIKPNVPYTAPTNTYPSIEAPAPKKPLLAKPTKSKIIIQEDKAYICYEENSYKNKTYNEIEIARYVGELENNVKYYKTIHKNDSIVNTESEKKVE